MDFVVNFGVVFQEDGLDKDGMREELSGLATIVQESDGTIEDKDGNEVPIWVYLMTGSLADYIGIRLKYNCDEYN